MQQVQLQPVTRICASLVSEHSPSGETFRHVLPLYSQEVPPPLAPAGLVLLPPRDHPGGVTLNTQVGFYLPLGKLQTGKDLLRLTSPYILIFLKGT